MFALCREEKVFFSLDSVRNYLVNRHATMIWTFILFSLITTAPPTSVSEDSKNVIRKDVIPEEESISCSRVDFVDYVSDSGSSILPAIEDLPVFGPQLPPTYEQYRRHAELNGSNGTVSNNGRVSLVDVMPGKDRLEADLDRLLAQEIKKDQNESTGTTKKNETASVEQQQPQQQDSDPPLPSFNEWTKQKLEEQLQTKQQLADAQLKNGAATGSPAVPVTVAGSVPSPSPDGTVKTIENNQHARNYASKECGAKVLLANPQAQHASSVLNEKEPDEYMLNPCNAEQKYFVVELCETVQITRLDLANFELFSSSPKDFRVFVSERYPATEWTFLGAWTAADQRKIQNFPVDLRLYAKYVKVELLSHYGSEHFCPLSLIRLLGISVVEEYEAEAAKEQIPQIKIEAEASPIILPNEPGEKAEEATPSPFEPSAAASAENRTSATRTAEPDPKTNFIIRQELLNSAKDVVVQMAKGVIDKAQAVFGGSKSPENETATNATRPIPDSSNNTATSEELESVPATLAVVGPIFRSEQWRRCLTCDISTNVTQRLCGYVRAFLVKRRMKTILNATVNGSIESAEKKEPVEATVVTVVEEVLVAATKDEKDQTIADPSQTMAAGNQKAVTPTPPLPKIPLTPPPTATSFPTTAAVDSSSLPGVATTAKETVFARLNSRIRALESNISLSGEYLGELSTRYRKQMDEMHKALNRSNAALAQHTKSTEEKLAQYRMDIELLQMELDKVKAQLLEYNDERTLGKIDLDMNETTTILGIEKTLSKADTWAPVILVVEIMAVLLMVMYCCRGRFGTDERVLEAMVERRVRQVMLEELRKLRKNGMSVTTYPLGSSIGNGHVPLDQSEGPSWRFDMDDHAAAPNEAMSHRLPSLEHSDGPPSISAPQKSPPKAAPAAVSNKAKKKLKKRQQQQQQRILTARKSSDQTSGFSSRRETRDDVPDGNDGAALNDSSAGILFSTSSQSTSTWRRVLPTWRRTALPNQKGQKSKRRGSDDQLEASKWKFHSQNAFEALASPSSRSGSRNRESPEKRPRVGRGPS